MTVLKNAHPDKSKKNQKTGDVPKNNNPTASHEISPENSPLLNGSESLDLYGEVGNLALSLNEMLSKFRSAGSMMESVSSELPFGTDELTDVSRKTEEATQKILDDADQVNDNHDLMSARLESLKSTLFDESITAEKKVKEDIKSLCQLVEESKKVMFNLVGTLSFQDPAGQQLRKVTSMLKMFQARILQMVVAFGHDARGSEVAEDRQEALLSELEYSSEGEPLEQDLVDSVLKEYGF